MNNEYAKASITGRSQRVADCTPEQIQTAVDSGFKRADVLVRGIAQDLVELGDLKVIKINADEPDMELPWLVDLDTLEKDKLERAR